MTDQKKASDIEKIDMEGRLEEHAPMISLLEPESEGALKSKEFWSLQRANISLYNDYIRIVLESKKQELKSSQYSDFALEEIRHLRAENIDLKARLERAESDLDFKDGEIRKSFNELVSHLKFSDDQRSKHDLLRDSIISQLRRDAAQQAQLMKDKSVFLEKNEREIEKVRQLHNLAYNEMLRLRKEFNRVTSKNESSQEYAISYIKDSKLFDADFYRNQSGLSHMNADALVEHYVKKGAAAGLSPSRDFDGAKYISENKDVAEAGVNPFYHFLAFGLYEGR